MTEKEHIKLLNQAFDNFQQITQWLPSHIDNADKYRNIASVLIDILEDDLFGTRRTSFKRGYVPKYETCGQRLYDRFYFIVKELGYEKKIKKVCYFDVESMHQYFKQLSNLRETFNK